MAQNEKLDWIYKGANSLVDREEYLLGRKVDKTLEQLNDEEKEKKFVLPTPKNHVEHECIPPSIRDFNKIVQAEQVDLSAKLQEDPLVAIKKREEEARRQFLQNPVQLKKLQDALKEKESQKKKHKKPKKKKRDSDLDNQIKEKLMKLKSNSLGVGMPKNALKKDKGDAINIILMHKFNALKNKLSEDDLKDILNGNVTDSSGDESSKKKNKRDISSDSNSDEEKKNYRKRNSAARNFKGQRSRSQSRDFGEKKRKVSKKENSTSSDEDFQRRGGARHSDKSEGDRYRNKRYNRSSNKEIFEQGRKESKRFDAKYRRTSRSRSRSADAMRRNRSLSRDKTYNKKKYDNSKNRQVDNRERQDRYKESSNDDLDKKIMAQLKILRGQAEEKKYMFPEKPPGFDDRDVNSSNKNRGSSSDNNQTKHNNKNTLLQNKSRKSEHSRKSSISSSSDSDTAINRYNSEGEEQEVKSFGLVSSAGKKLTLNKTEQHTKLNTYANNKNNEPAKPERKHVKRMTQEEKERLRKEMMINAKTRDEEREANVKRYKETDKREEETVTKEFDVDLVHTKLLKAAKLSSVEQRIKSNLNNIQRSSTHMDKHFSRR